MAPTMSFLLTILLLSLSNLAMAAYNILDFGARPDGRTDSATAFLGAWAKACGASKPATIYVPAGRFFLSQATFQGPCNSARLRISIDGTIVAPATASVFVKWMFFKNVEGLSIYGGTLDGRGQALWACKLAGRRCPVGATSLTIDRSKNVLISGLTSLNSEQFHVSIQNSNGVTVQNVKIDAPDESPNTDGIHIRMSTGVTVTGSTIKTGDDCISVKEGVANVWIERINCGPGHGISIGSLGNQAQEEGVRNVTVKSVVFTGTQNGLRIKTWGRPTNGFVTGVKFQQAVMKNVKNPIIIDQNYCPDNINCPGQSSGVKISEVSFSDIRGTSATKVAVKLDCSPSNPCTGMGLQDIKLTYGNNEEQSFCRNVRGSATRVKSPRSCL